MLSHRVGPPQYKENSAKHKGYREVIRDNQIIPRVGLGTGRCVGQTPTVGHVIEPSLAVQVIHYHKIGALHYAMTDRLKTFGFSWIEIVDEDPGRSAAGAVARAGFDHMVSG